MACDSLVSQLVTESGRVLSEEVYRRVVPTSPLIKLQTKDSFPESMGEVISNLTYERTAPTDATQSWADVADSTIDSSCTPTPATISFASTLRTWNLQQFTVNGPEFCVKSLRTKFALRKQLDSIAEIMAQYARIVWEIRYRSENIRVAGRKVVCGPTYPLTEGTGAGFPGTAATSQLTQGILDYYRMLHIRDGATALGMRDGTPILTLMCSAEISQSLIFQNADIRQDIRWGKPSELLAPFGVDRDYKGYYHLIDLFPKRYSFGGGAYTEIAAWTNAAATNGTKQVLNSSWLSAAYEAAYIFDPGTMTARFPRQITNPGGGMKFDPYDSMGQFGFRNILDKNCNPDGTKLFPRAIFEEASEPVRPERSSCFIYLRCDPAIGAILSCS